MNEYVRNSLIILVIFATGAAIGRFSLPAKVVEKEKIVVQEKIVEKQVEVTDVKKKDHKIYIRIEHTSKDGSKTVETRIMDDASSDTSDKKTDDKTDDKTTTDEKTKETTYAQQNTIISLLADATFNGIQGPNFGLMVQKRILGPVYIDAFGFMDKSFGLGVGLAF